MACRADFRYLIAVLDHQKVLLIEDLNLGNMSVTNDIENVVASISQKENIDPKGHLIIYMDSEGRWDGWDATREEFFFFKEEKRDPLAQLIFKLTKKGHS